MKLTYSKRFINRIGLSSETSWLWRSQWWTQNV